MPCVAGRAFAAAEDETEKVFRLREVSVFEQAELPFLRGQSAQCQHEPFAELRSYPTFVSKQPVYGSVRFAADSGQTNGGMLFYFAIDESQGTGKGYDRLYFDFNRDLDLRNDPVVMPQRDSPTKTNPFYRLGGQVLFAVVTINFDFGPAGIRPVEIMPQLMPSFYARRGYDDVTFARTRLYEGEIKLGDQSCKAQLGNDFVIRGRLDLPDTALVLTPKGNRRPISWQGGDRLMAAHKVHGRFFTLSASPTGEQLTVHPYEGDLGIFEIGPGGRAIENLGVAGSLESKDLAVPVGDEVERDLPKRARRCQVPVGDYSPSYISVQFGCLRIDISQNCHSEGKRGDRGGRARVYGLTIRKDQPCVLDFSNKPDIVFASPSRAQRFKPGDRVDVRAVLVDPKLDFMIRGLTPTMGGLAHTTRKRTKTTTDQAPAFEDVLSLDPKVLITRANGEKVAEGVMPFG